MKTLGNIESFNAFFHQKTTHKLMSVASFPFESLSTGDSISMKMYWVILLPGNPGLVFTGNPGQSFIFPSSLKASGQGWVLAFCPEMVNGTGLGRDFYMFNFFDYEDMETLEINDMEQTVLENCFQNILAELNADDDDLTSHMLRLGMGQLLSYCRRFYDRQFGNKRLRTSELIVRLDTIINGYLADATDLKLRLGPPSVAWCSSQFHLTPNYFGDLVKQKLGISARKYIQTKVAELACSLLLEPQNSVGEVAVQLGFNYPNHFTRFFRQQMGVSPLEFKHSKKMPIFAETKR